MTTLLVFVAAYYITGLGLIGRIMWAHRPNGLWWLLLPGFALIWPYCLIDYVSP